MSLVPVVPPIAMEQIDARLKELSTIRMEAIALIQQARKDVQKWKDAKDHALSFNIHDDLKQTIVESLDVQIRKSERKRSKAVALLKAFMEERKSFFDAESMSPLTFEAIFDRHTYIIWLEA